MSLVKTVNWPPKLDYTNQSVAVPGTKQPSQTAHYRNGAFGLVDSTSPGTLCVLPEIFETGLQLSRDGACLGHRPVVSTKPLEFMDRYIWLTYAEVDARRRRLGSALHTMFENGELGGGDLETVGIWANNRPEWQIVDLALHAYRKVGVSLYDTMGKESVEYIINHANMSVVFASSQHIPTLLKMSPQIPILKMVVSLDVLSQDTKNILSSWASSRNLRFMELVEIEALGEVNLLNPLPATPDQVATLCYTSGTTGKPKGVVLTHNNLAMGTQANLYGVSYTCETTLLSYLPLAHIFGRISELTVMAVGGRIGYFTGDPLRLIEDARILKPHFFPSVPRVLNRVYQAIMAGGNTPGVKGALFRAAVCAKLQQLHISGSNMHPVWDKVVFSGIRAVLGGNIQIILTGSAPIRPDVVNFLKIAFSCDVLEGYGMTENSGTCTKCWPRDPSASGTVGPPQASTEIKLVDVPSMGYTSKDKPNPRGEICSRGTSCFNTYYKDPDNTKKTIEEDGWVHTGDIGELDSYGRFKIIDRIKNIIKLSQGEYVALEKIENVYDASKLVAQIYIHGDSLQPYLVGIIIPDISHFAFASSGVLGTGISPEDPVALTIAASDDRVKTAILSSLTEEAKQNGLTSLEIIKRIHFAFEPFSVENGLLTPTFKIRRKDIYNKYQAEIEALYALDDLRLGSETRKRL